MKPTAESSESKSSNQVMERMHSLFLEALRQREQDIIRYIAILAPALGGFFFLLFKKSYMSEWTFIVGVLGVQGILLVGAIYAAALSYNYRCIVLQIVKLEKELDVASTILKAWPRDFNVLKDQFRIRHTGSSVLRERRRWRDKLSDLEWFWPPEIIKVFWWSFALSIFLVSLVAFLTLGLVLKALLPVLFGLGALAKVAVASHIYGKKLYRMCDMELVDQTPDG